MNSQIEQDLINKYTNFKTTASKIGLEEALVQYKTIGLQDWKLENGMLVIELIELFDDIEEKHRNMTTWKYLLEGFVHLPTRLEIINGLTKHNRIACKEVSIIAYLNEKREIVQRLKTCFWVRYFSEMIYKIIEEYPEYAFIIRFKLTEMQILPDLITRLTVVYCRDTVEFLNGIFYSKSTWFLTQSVNSGQYFVKMKSRIMADIEANVKLNGQINPVAVSLAIRALVGIIAYFGIKLNETEVALCIKLLGKIHSRRLVELLLCLLLLSADQFLKKQNELSKVLIQLLQSEVSEMPLLILVYFQTDAIQQVEDMIRSVLSMHIPIPKLGLFEMQKLFTSLKLSTMI
ncbi:hypothetical protein [Parasitella parasitica]|uniref:Uncharacterized protein n=1 Tax=Parasitella parasitica TaxID=35722 RepID=A0A0B7MN31_9FUNG|nr:hypothetical protein [Parasitella parasitica]